MDALRGRPRDQAQENEAPEAPEAPEIPEPIVGQDLLGRDPRLAFLLDLQPTQISSGIEPTGPLGGPARAWRRCGTLTGPAGKGTF